MAPPDSAVPHLPAELTDEDLARALVVEAARLALRTRDAGLDVGTKAGVTDLVTSADLAAETYVVETLRRTRPYDGILGEEGARHEGTGRTWVVDPVDGTWNFAHHGLNWCTALALREDASGDVLAAAVGHLAGGEVWAGGRDLPTTCDTVPVPRLADRPARESSIATYAHPSTLSDPDVREPFLRVVATAGTLRVLGSASVDLAWVAGGRIGVWAQHSVAPWDWLPGRALVEGAGGTTDVVEHRGHTWCLAGNAQAVADVRAALVAS